MNDNIIITMADCNLIKDALFEKSVEARALTDLVYGMIGDLYKTTTFDMHEAISKLCKEYRNRIKNRIDLYYKAMEPPGYTERRAKRDALFERLSKIPRPTTPLNL